MSVGNAIQNCVMDAVSGVLGAGSSNRLTGYIVVSDNTPDEGDTLTLTFVETSVTGEFTASDLTPDEGDELTLEFVPVAYTYQWKKDGDNLSDGGDISGATTEELTITNADPDDDGDYTVEVTNPTSGRVRTFGPENIVVTPTPVPETLTFDSTLATFDSTAETFDQDA